MKIGITGASGLLGSHLAKLLLEDANYNVKGLHSSGYVPDILAGSEMEWVQGDLRDYHVLPDFIADVDIVVHAAAVVSFKKNENDNMFRINVDGTKMLIDCLEGTGKKLIHISSIATLGRKTGKLLIDESDFWNDSLQFTSYAHSKFLAEMEVERGIAEGLDAMIFQPSIILGATERKTSSSSIWTQIEKMPTLAPRGANGFVDVKDVASYIKNGIENWNIGEKMIVSGHNLKYAEIYDFVNKYKANGKKVKSLDPRVLLFLLPFVLVIFKILGIKSEISKSAIVTTSKSYGFDNSKSIELLGNHYTSWQSTIERIMKTIQKD